MSNTIRIEKFNGKNNFNLWRIKMRALLKKQHLWAPVASASVKKPVTSDSKEKASASKTEELTEQEEKAHSLILLSMSDEVLYEVANEETASGLWLKLEKLYMTKSICNKLDVPSFSSIF